MKYTKLQLKSMAETVLGAKALNDSRYNSLVHALIKRTSLSLQEVQGRIFELSKFKQDK